MSESNKFTPGPWVAVYTPSMNSAGVHIRNRQTGNEIAYCNSSDDIRPEADARLISAAPELLEAAEKFLAAVQKAMPSDKLAALNGANEMLVLMEAIAKARGES